jgi:hypothetical protein
MGLIEAWLLTTHVLFGLVTVGVMVDAVFRFERCTHESFAKAFLKECCRRCKCGQLNKGKRGAKTKTNKKKKKKKNETPDTAGNAATKEAKNVDDDDDDDGESGDGDHFQTSRQVSSS